MRGWLVCEALRRGGVWVDRDIPRTDTSRRIQIVSGSLFSLLLAMGKRHSISCAQRKPRETKRQRGIFDTAGCHEFLTLLLRLSIKTWTMACIHLNTPSTLRR